MDLQESCGEVLKIGAGASVGEGAGADAGEEKDGAGMIISDSPSKASTASASATAVGTSRQSARALQLTEEAEAARLEAQQIADAIAKSDQSPAKLILLEGKGSKVDTEVEIAEEGAFHEAEEDDKSDGFGAEYIIFGRKYYGIALLNAVGRKVRPPKMSVVVTCQVHRVGLTQPLASTPLVEAWSDGAYYFSSAVFIR